MDGGANRAREKEEDDDDDVNRASSRVESICEVFPRKDFIKQYPHGLCDTFPDYARCQLFC